ncbi:MAG: glycosyl hydrolase 53 family protein, partial [Eubacterium sp.]
ESQLNDTYYLDWYNSGDNGSTDIYELIMYENIQVTEAGTYYLWGETMGEWASGELLLEAYEYESGNNIVSMNLDASGSWCDWAYAYSAGFELEAGDIIQFYFIMQATPDNSPYGDIDNLKLVKAEDLANTIADFNERQAPDKTDKFANGSFGKYGFDYWDNVTGDNDTVNYAYGYAFPGYGNGAEIVYDSAGAEVTASSTYDGCLNVYSNSETVNYTLSFEQDDIIITRPGDYTIGCFLKGYLGDDGTTTDAGIFIVVTDSEGNELCNSQVTPYSNEEWTEAKSDVFTMDAAGTINVTINVKLPYSHEETAEDETTFTCNPSVMFDDFTIEEPDADVSVANANELGYEGVTYRNAEGDVIYANGGNTIKGVDVSSVISLENAGITFKNEAGEEEDLFQILADNGVNYIRCRVWNNPFDSNGNGFGGGNCDVSVLTAIAERCANAGLSLYIDFHYSDFWADPSSQVVPAAWSGYNVTEKAAALASFTTETLTTVAATGVNIGIVSLGNETNNGRMAGEITVNNFITLANAGSAAVRAFDPDIMIALHFAPTEGGWLVWEYKTLRLRKVDFDIFAASCYPYYESHSSDGTIKTIVSELNNIANKYHKLTMIAEYDWPYTWTDYDGYYTGQIKSTDGLNMNWDVSTEGQGNMIKDIITATCNASSGYTTETEDDDTTIVDYGIANCVGSFYWEGAWVGLADSTAWDTYGIGVYSAAGAVEKGWGTSGVGTVHEILSFFDENATATSAIQSFATVTDTHPIDVALVQTSSVSDGTYNLRMVGTVSENCLAWSDGSNIGFRVIVYDADGNVVKSLSDKVTTKVYSSVLANGEAVTPGEGKYFYTYAFRNIPEGTTYYFKIMSNADDSWSYHQRAAKTVKVLDGTATVVDSNTFAEIE